jgi:hypothetical protein
VVRRIEVRTGITGYRNQLDRMRRYLGRVLDRERPPYVVDYQDDVWAFFQACWHLKDWMKHDPLVPAEKKQRVIAAAEASKVLAIANDMANSTKHHVLHAGGHAARKGLGRASSMLLEIQIPVLEQRFRQAVAGEPLAVVGLDRELAVVAEAQIVDMTAMARRSCPPLLRTFTITSGVRRTVRAMCSSSPEGIRSRRPGPGRA